MEKDGTLGYMIYPNADYSDKAGVLTWIEFLKAVLEYDLVGNLLRKNQNSNALYTLALFDDKIINNDSLSLNLPGT